MRTTSERIVLKGLLKLQNDESVLRFWSFYQVLLGEIFGGSLTENLWLKFIGQKMIDSAPFPMEVRDFVILRKKVEVLSLISLLAKNSFLMENLKGKISSLF